MKVAVEPLGASFDIEPDETIIQAAWRAGYTWPTICNGQGNCKVCVTLVLDGLENLLPIEAYEEEGLAQVRDTLPNGGEGWRLACQARVRGDIRVKKIGVKPEEARS